MMITLESMLPTADLASFNDLVAQATAEGAGAVMWHSAASGVAIIGFCRGGELLTWFATPAATETEAAVARAVILAGVTQASHTMAADEAIKKAMH